MRELLAIALMIAATALLIKWGSWLLSNIDEALDEKVATGKNRGERAASGSDLGNDIHSTSPRTGQRGL